MGSEWLFPVAADDWELTTLGEICKRAGGDIQTGPFGSQLHAADYVPVGIPSIMPQNLSTDRISTEGIAYVTVEDAVRLERYRVRTGDIIYSRRGDVERRALVTEVENGWLCGTGCLRVRLGSGYTDPLYTFYYLGHPSVREWVVRHAIGATLPNLNTSILSALPFVLPSLEEQKYIASILGSLDDKIELNRRMNATLEATARALFQSWFVDFDPVRAKMDGRQPHGLDAATAALFPDRLVDSALGPIPAGWRVGSLSETIQILGGGTPKTSVAEYWNGDIPWFSVTDLPAPSNMFAIDTDKKITQDGLNNSSTRILPYGTTIVTARGTVGKLALVGIPMAMNQSCYGILGNDYYYTFFRVQTVTAELQRNTHGTVFDTITRETFEQVQIAIPSKDVIHAFESWVTPKMELVLSNLHQSRTLARMRDVLLPKLLSGEVRV